MGSSQAYLYASVVLFLVASFVTDGRAENELGDHIERTNNSLAAKANFKCPFPFGAYSDPEDCSYYYVCVAGIHARKKCGFLRRFDFLRRVCLPIPIAMCWGSRVKTTASPQRTTVAPSTKPEETFRCPTIIGSFPHPTDCSKYFRCTVFVSSLKSCPEGQLFDVQKKKCRPAKEVNCDDRDRPGDDLKPTESITTSTEMTTSETMEVTTEATEAPTTTQEPTTEEPTTVEQTTTPEPTTEEPTTVEQTTTQEPTTEAPTTEEQTTTREPTTEEPTTVELTTKTTTTPKPTGPPETDCDEDDVDCIVDETGDPTNWFTCTEDIGYYIHPSSDKLFIFCLNWIPSVKRCGQDLIFSKELLTCVSPDYHD